jgi:hypothetical protein
MSFRMNALRIGWLKPAEGFRLSRATRDGLPNGQERPQGVATRDSGAVRKRRRK